MATLYTYNRSENLPDALLMQLEATDALILMGPAVVLLPSLKAVQAQLYLLEDHLRKRNLSTTNTHQAHVISLSELVTLTEEYPKYIAW
ncbi:DsrH/TusB family sulfur metabolism protein [Gynuella sp.]|uniref:DsrH/TusB family sulfur metabolism protein n=1 Tax=Gynuella sp. TaxID=2969146 RepID=UPI003D09EF3E